MPMLRLCTSSTKVKELLPVLLSDRDEQVAVREGGLVAKNSERYREDRKRECNLGERICYKSTSLLIHSVGKGARTHIIL